MTRLEALQLVCDAFRYDLTETMAEFLLDRLERFSDEAVVGACTHIAESVQNRPGNIVALVLAHVREQSASTREQKEAERSKTLIKDLPADIRDKLTRFIGQASIQADDQEAQAPDSQ